MQKESRFLYTIITICYNAGSELKRTMESVLGQSYSDFEYLIVDGVSTDGTADIVKSYKDTRVKFFSERDYGIYNAMNRGIGRAEGKFLFFLNAGDTFYDKNVLKNVAECIEDEETIYIGIINGINMDGSEELTDCSKLKGTFGEILKQGGGPCHQAIFAPRGFLTDHYFRESFQLAADLEWFTYCFCKGKKCRCIPVVISNYQRFGISGQVKNRKRYLEEADLIIHEYFSEEEIAQTYEENYRGLQIEQEKTACIMREMNLWLRLKSKNIRIGSFLKEKNWMAVAIYGMGMLGQQLLEDMENEGLSVACVFDKNPDRSIKGYEVLLPGKGNRNFDVLIVTADFYFQEICREMEKYVSAPIVSLESILLCLSQNLRERNKNEDQY